MIKNIKKIVAVLNDFEKAEAVLAKAFLFAKAEDATVEVIYVHEVPWFALPDYFVLESQKGKDTLNKAQVRKEIRQRIAALEYDKECTLLTYIADTASRVAHRVKDAENTLIVTAYHDTLSETLLKNVVQPVLFAKTADTSYQDIVLNVTLEGQSKACIETAKSLFSESSLKLLYDYRYIVDPSMELDIQNLSIIEESQRKVFEGLKKHSDLEGTFFIDGTFEGEDLRGYLEKQAFDLMVVCARSSDFFGINPLAMDLLKDDDIHGDILVQSTAITQQKLDTIKEAVMQTDSLPKEEKALAVQKIEAWYAEDRGMELLSEQLLQVSKNIRPILAEMGLL